jgi:hypothetical protein
LACWCGYHQALEQRPEPFYIDNNGELIFTPTSSSWHAWYKDEIMSAYRHVIADRQGKPAPTQRMHSDYFGPTTSPSGKTLNSKAVGRLLAAGGVYNGNIEGFHETAQQLRGMLQRATIKS